MTLSMLGIILNVLHKLTHLTGITIIKCMFYWFSIAGMTNYLKFSVLKQYKFTSQFL